MIQIRIGKFLNSVRNEDGINFFTRFMSTIVANSLFSRCFIWSSQVRFSSIMTPKNLTLSAFFTFCPLTDNEKPWSYPVVQTHDKRSL